MDVEGFSVNYEFSEERKTYAICALAELMNAIYKIGSRYYIGTPERNYSERLFAHQYGDGFIVCSDFPEADGSRAVAIGIAVMRHMTLCGYATKAAISAGDLSDISGCYPTALRNASSESVAIGHGVMTTIAVMGTAVTKAHKLGSTSKGAVLVLDEDVLALGLPDGARAIQNRIDWVSSQSPLADDIAKQVGLRTAAASTLCERLRAYCAACPTPPPAWIEATFATVCAGGV